MEEVKETLKSVESNDNLGGSKVERDVRSNQDEININLFTVFDEYTHQLI